MNAYKDRRCGACTHTYTYMYTFLYMHVLHTHTHLPYVYMCMYIYCFFDARLRPVHLFPSQSQEWIATCPIMQLKLVALAGARVPSYRRFMMPLLSVAVLLCGTASMFTGDALRFGWYGFGLCCLTWGLWGLKKNRWYKPKMAILPSMIQNCR